MAFLKFLSGAGLSGLSSVLKPNIPGISSFTDELEKKTVGKKNTKLFDPVTLIGGGINKLGDKGTATVLGNVGR